MRNSLRILLSCLLFLPVACSPKIYSEVTKQYDILSYDVDVNVLGINDKKPKNCIPIGTIKARDSGFSTKCNFNQVVEKAKLEARKLGGDIIQITKHKKPNFWSTCHRVDFNILRTKP